MTLVTLWPSRARVGTSASASSDPLPSLILLMAIFSPVCHMHYLLFCLPSVMGLLLHTWQRQGSLRVPWGLTICFIVFNATMLVAYLPGLEPVRDLCVALFATVPLWVIPVAQMWRGTPATPPIDAPSEMRRAA
jgi:hypothetical protein